MDTNTVITNWKKGTTEFECINPNGVSTVLGTSSEAEGKIASPKAIMLGSLAVCSGLDVIAILKKMRVELDDFKINTTARLTDCLLYTSPSPRDGTSSRMPSSA